MNKSVVILFFITLLSSCAHQYQESTSELNQLTPETVSFNFNYTIRPGEVALIQFPHFYAGHDGILRCREATVPFIKEELVIKSYVVESYFSSLEPFECFYEVNNRRILVARFAVEQKIFPSETLNVDMRHVVLSAKDQKRVEDEQVFLNQNYAASPARPYFSAPFRIPLDSLVTSIYGSRRLFNHQKQTQHLGTDYRAMPGVPIHAVNAGKVVVARDLFYTGLTVTIDHGMNIFTVYGHLSKLDVVEGEFIPQGTLLGLSGATGRVTGPHLHWGVRVQGHFIDGDTLVSESRKAWSE